VPVAARLLENALATAAGLAAIILMFGPVSGAHFNLVVSLADASFGGISRRDTLAYIPTQIAGCILGAIAANAMFALAAISISTKHRASGPHLLSGSYAAPSPAIVALVVGASAGHGSARATARNASRAGAVCAGLHMTSIRSCSTSPTRGTQRRPSGSDARTDADAGSTARPSATSANVGSKGRRGVTMRGVNPAAAQAARTAS
jgi:glycerol uptake facilitator-like aquaporin